MKVAVVIPVGPGRLENLEIVLASLRLQSREPDLLVLVEDGPDAGVESWLQAHPDPDRLLQWFTLVVNRDKHQPGMEQPRNVGVRMARELDHGITHVWFVDSDVVMATDALAELERVALSQPEPAIVVAPYDWLPPGARPPAPAEDLPEWLQTATAVRNDPRWEMFSRAEGRLYREDLSAGLACFSGNLLWPVDAFRRIGGFWSEIHHGRCEDGELGLRAVAMGVPIALAPGARGFHLWHPVNTQLAIERNARDVPMLNARHPWVEQGAVFLVDRDGAAFDVRCSGCGELVPTIGWWDHAPACGVGMDLHAPRP